MKYFLETRRSRQTLLTGSPSVHGYSSQLLFSPQLRFVVSACVKRFEPFEPKTFQRPQVRSIVILRTLIRIELIQNLKSKVIAIQLVPISLQTQVLMDTPGQLKSVPVHDARQIQAARDKYFFIDQMSDLKDTHPSRALFVPILQRLFVLFHLGVAGKILAQ
jgi:hypothetical protein